MTIQEKLKIAKDLKYILSRNTGVNCNVANLMLDWGIGKKDFIKAFGEKLIYEYPEPVTFSLSPAEKDKLYYVFLDWLDSAFVWSDIKSADLGGLYEFVATNKEDFFTNHVSKDINIQIFRKDKVESDIIPDLETITIPKGMKFIKAFKYFIWNDKELLKTIQDKASEYI